jgi:hypothetical protein
MEEKIYKLMNGTGAANIVIGVLAIVIGIGLGVVLIVCGSKLLANKSKLIF